MKTQKRGTEMKTQRSHYALGIMLTLILSALQATQNAAHAQPRKVPGRGGALAARVVGLLEPLTNKWKNLFPRGPGQSAPVPLSRIRTFEDLSTAVRSNSLGKGNGVGTLLDTVSGFSTFACAGGNPFKNLSDTRPLAMLFARGVETVEVKTKRTTSLDATLQDEPTARQLNEVDMLTMQVTHPDGSNSSIDVYKPMDNPFAVMMGGADLRPTRVVINLSKGIGGGKQEMSRTWYENGKKQGNDHGNYTNLWNQRAPFTSYFTH